VNQATLTRQGSIIRLPDVETLLGITQSTLRVYVREGRLPRPRRLGKALFWRRDELEACLAEAPVATTWPGLGEGERAPDLTQEEVEAA